MDLYCISIYCSTKTSPAFLPPQHFIVLPWQYFCLWSTWYKLLLPYSSIHSPAMRCVRKAARADSKLSWTDVVWISTETFPSVWQYFVASSPAISLYPWDLTSQSNAFLESQRQLNTVSCTCSSLCLHSCQFSSWESFCIAVCSFCSCWDRQPPCEDFWGIFLKARFLSWKRITFIINQNGNKYTETVLTD